MGARAIDLINIQSNIVEIDISDLAAGIYSYSLISTEELKTSRGKFTVTNN